MTKVVITDLDGVIRHWTRIRTAEVEAHCQLPAGTLGDICFQPDLLLPAITGQNTREGWFESAHAALTRRYGHGIAERYIDAWRNEHYRIDQELLDQFRNLFPDAQLALATNATTALPIELAAAGLTGQFDAVFNSSAMGVAKPAHHYFYAVLMSLGVAAAEVVYIDDSLANVEAARKLGMPSFHFRNRAELLSVLTQHALKSSVLTG